MAKVLSSITSKESITPMSCWPMPSRAPQRSSEAMQSSEVTGSPSCHSRPSRSVKVQVRLSSLTSQLSTICGCGVRLSSMAKSVS